MVKVSCRKQIGIGELMVLIAGAAAGLALTRVALKDVGVSGTELDFTEGWLWVCVGYASVLGMAMPASGLLVADRILRGYRWKTGAMAWFAIGCLAWLQSAFLAVDHLLLGRSTFVWFTLECLTGGLHIACVLFFVTCLASGRSVGQWWRGRGWWPEWTGMWLLCVMSIVGSVAFVLQLVSGYEFLG